VPSTNARNTAGSIPSGIPARSAPPRRARQSLPAPGVGARPQPGARALLRFPYWPVRNGRLVTAVDRHSARPIPMGKLFLAIIIVSVAIIIAIAIFVSML
jgi:hypothetical protein